jgi:hypothetical protein
MKYDSQWLHFNHSVSPRAFTNFHALDASGVTWPQAGQQAVSGVEFGLEILRTADMMTLSADTNDYGHLVGQIDFGSGPSAFNVNPSQTAVSSNP